jgi:hypothetical protein
MKEFRVTWAKYPTNFNPEQATFVEAATSDDAEELVKNHIERNKGLSRNEILIFRVTEAPKIPAGRVLS